MIRKLEKNRQHNGQKKKYKKTKHRHKTKDRVTQTIGRIRTKNQ